MAHGPIHSQRVIELCERAMERLDVIVVQTAANTVEEREAKSTSDWVQKIWRLATLTQRIEEVTFVTLNEDQASRLWDAAGGYAPDDKV